MILADRIRHYVIKGYVEPARRKGRSVVAVRAGDIHKEMELRDRMPAVCGALDARKFSECANLYLLNRSGPPQGANVVFTFRIL